MNTVYYMDHDNIFYIKFQSAWEHTLNWHIEFLPPYQRGTTDTVKLPDFRHDCVLWFVWWAKRRFCSSSVAWSSCGALFQMDPLEAGAFMHLFRLWCPVFPQVWVSLLCTLKKKVTPIPLWFHVVDEAVIPFLILQLPKSDSWHHRGFRGLFSRALHFPAPSYLCSLTQHIDCPSNG